MFGRIFQYIDTHPRLILLVRDPILSVFLAALIWIIWKGPWISIEAVQHQQLALLGSIALGVVGAMTLSQVAQSMIFFGKLGFKVGDFLNVNAVAPDLRGQDASDRH